MSWLIILYIHLAAARLVAVPEDIRFDGVEAAFLSLVDEIGPHLHCHCTRRACAARPNHRNDHQLSHPARKDSIDK